MHVSYICTHVHIHTDIYTCTPLMCVYMYVNMHMKMDVRNLIERTPPPWGGFLFTMFPHQEP